MEKIIRFKRNWEEGFIRISICEGDKVEIDSPLYLFEKRFKEKMEIPNIRFKSTENGKKMVLEAMISAFEATISELKEETKRV